MPDGERVDRFVLARDGVEVSLLGYGASLQAVRAPDRAGRPGHVVLGFDHLDAYRADPFHFGAVVGRFANRIAGAGFVLDGRPVRLTANLGEHHLHGGAQGLGRRVWRGESFEESDAAGVLFDTVSEDGDEGYPGRLHVTASYRLRDRGELVLELRARTDRPTIVNLSHHAYFHLGDGGATTVFDHRVEVESDRALEVDADGLPSGRFVELPGSSLDLRPQSRGETVRLGDRIPALESARGGFDHCYVLRGGARPDRPRPVARVLHPGSGRLLVVETDQPGLQVYTGNFLGGRLAGHDGIAYGRWHALCLEPQGFPDAPNRPRFPSTRLEPGEEYRHTSIFRFGLDETGLGRRALAADGRTDEKDQR